VVTSTSGHLLTNPKIVYPIFIPSRYSPTFPPSPSSQRDIWLLLFSGLAISVLLSNYWDFTVSIKGKKHSAGLLILTFLAGGVCTSTGVVNTPYLANSQKSYTSAYTGGGGLSGLLVAFLTIIADSGSEHPRLPIKPFFQVISGIFIIGMLAFAYIQYTIGTHSDLFYLPITTTDESTTTTTTTGSPPSAVVAPTSTKKEGEKGYGSTAEGASGNSHQVSFF